VAKTAHELLQHPKVNAKLRELRVKAEANSTLAASLTKSFVLNGIMSIALEGDKDSTRLRAYELLGKTVGLDLFRTTVVTETRTRTPEEIDAELRERLAGLADTLTIEGEARRVEKPAPDDRRRKPRT